MSTVAHYIVPAADFALAETFQTVPEATVASNQIVASSVTSTLPLIWVRAQDPSAVEDALASDTTVATATPLAETGPAWLYRIDWSQRVTPVVDMLTTPNTTLLDATGTTDGWQFRVLYSDREAIRSAYECCKTHNVSVDIRTIRTPDGDTHPQRGPGWSLTEAQYEALVRAYNRGYFAVPRAVDLDTLAEDLDISHQALSERLRRAHAMLIKEALKLSLSETGAAPAPSVPGRPVGPAGGGRE